MHGHSRPRPPELLSPARDRSCLSAAVAAGCDAVYFGLSQWNMRDAAPNFRRRDLPWIRATCRDAEIRAYLTLNTLLYDKEMRAVDELIRDACSYVDAVICWDPAVIGMCRDRRVPFHVSTQASVASARAARFYETLGASRIIPARECTLAQLARIRRETRIELEVFAHGAMCSGVSGRCFLSQDTFGRSANRGECLQNCRREYLIQEIDGEGEFRLGASSVLSARDLCTLPFLDRLLAAGPAALKIEGRNRGPDYVAVTTAAYRRGIDAWAAGTWSVGLAQSLVGDVKTVYNRGFSAGFFMGRPVDAFTTHPGNRAAYVSEQVGCVVNWYGRVGVAQLEVRNHGFKLGDTLVVMGPTTGAERVVVKEIRDEQEQTVERAGRGLYTVPVPRKVRRSDRVQRLRPRGRARETGE